MCTRPLGFALCAGLALSACATAHSSRLSQDHALAAGACADWRWIGITDASTNECPTPGWGWSVKPLFKPAAKAEECLDERRSASYADVQPQPQPGPTPTPTPREQHGIPTADVVDQLSRFCVYETTSSKTPWHPPFRSAESAGLVALDRDCAGISRAQSASPIDLSAANIVDVSEHFFAQAGMPRAMEINNQGGVRLAFLDTEPTGVGVPTTPGSSMHGYTLANIANRLVCSPEHPERCAAQITTRLAMPMLSFDRARRNPGDFNYTNGGGFGTQADLANAIFAEVNDWRAENLRREKKDRQHLVLNLSLGWDPQMLGGLDAERIADLKAGSQAVFRALQYAKSLDVLVLAAAGNRRDCCPDTAGPLLPAAWEESYPADDAYREPPQTPLLYAVGGVGSDGRPLTNARELGMPKRVAYGENAVLATRAAPDPGALKPDSGAVTSTWLYTGSSVATAVVSATAALVWDTRPTLTPDRVMQALYDNSTAMPFEADFWFEGGAAHARTPAGRLRAADALRAPAARQVSVCHALLAACDGDPCPVDERDCPAAVLHRTVFPDWAAQSISTACHPWLVPQPEDPLCPQCGPPYRP